MSKTNKRRTPSQTESPGVKNAKPEQSSRDWQLPVPDDMPPQTCLTSIRTKLIVAVVLVSFITASLISAMQIRRICRDILKDTRLQAAALAVPVENAINALPVKTTTHRDFQDLLNSRAAAQVQKTLADTLAWPGRKDIVAAYITDKQGKLLLGKARNQLLDDVPPVVFDSKLAGAQTPRIIKNGDRYDTFVPFTDNSEQFTGYIVVGISALSIWDNATHLAAGTIISFAIVSLITVLVLGLWVSRYMVRPIRQITENIALSAKEGTMKLGNIAKTGDEIGLLARVADKVLPELCRQRQELRTAGTQLAAENTKLERTKRALMETERRYRSAVEAATGIAYELDLATGKFIFLSRHIYDLVGLAAEDLPTSFVWTEHIHQDDREDALAVMQACASGQRSCFSRAYRFLCKNGDALPMIELGGLVTNESGKAARISGLIIPAHMIPKSLLASN